MRRAWVNDVPNAWQEDRACWFLASSINRRTNFSERLRSISWISYNRRAELALPLVRTSCTCRGTATESTLMLATYGFQQLGLKRIEIVAAVGNYASQKVTMAKTRRDPRSCSPPLECRRFTTRQSDVLARVRRSCRLTMRVFARRLSRCCISFERVDPCD